MRVNGRRAARAGRGVAALCGALGVVLTLCGCEVLGVRPVLGADRVNCKYELLEYSLSPDGKHLAELVGMQHATAGREKIVYGRVDQRRAHWTALFEGSGISDLRWLNEATLAFVESRSGDHLVTENVRDHQLDRIVNTKGSILDFRSSGDGRAILYAFRDVPPQTRQWISKAVPDGLGVTAVALPAWATNTPLGGDYSQGRTTVAVWHKGHGGIRYSTALNVSQLVWIGGQSGSAPAVLQLTSETSPWEKSLVDLSTRETIASGRELGFIALIAVSRSGLVAAAATGPPSGSFESSQSVGLYVLQRNGRLTRVSLDSSPANRVGQISALWWIGDAALLADVAESDHPGGPYDHRLVEIVWKTGEIVKTIRWPAGSLDGCQVNRNRTIAVCQADELTEAGQLVLVDLSSGSMLRLAAPLSPCIRRLHISFREIKVRNRDGGLSTGFLALPDRRAGGDAEGKGGIPLAIMLYAFNRTFAADGEWIRAYPVARLVSAGIGVLLLNFPHLDPWQRGDASAARRELLEGPVSTVEAAPAAVAATGIRVGRAMVMGWSWGGFVASHVIEESCRFVAAEVGDPASYNVASYALNNATWRDYANALFGGPPDARYMRNYLAFDPESSGLPPKGPILLEFVSRNLDAGQYLEEWRGAGAYVEAFAYHFSPHALSVPAEARISRERNLLWAELNLLQTRKPTAAELGRVGLEVPPTSAYRCH